MNHVLVALPNERTIRIPIRLSVGNQIVETTAVVDCGATGNFIDLELISLAEFPLQCLQKPVKAYNVDGTTNSKGNIVWETQIDVLFQSRKENVQLMVLNLGRKQVILGMPWLWKWNPQINWLMKTLTIPQGIRRKDVEPLHESLPFETESTIPQRYLLCWLGMDTDLKTTQRFWKRKQWLTRETVGKVTISAWIAQETLVQEAVLPEWCQDFSDVFSEKTHDKLPPHQPYDHVIDLKPTFTLKITKVYSLNP